MSVSPGVPAGFRPGRPARAAALGGVMAGTVSAGDVWVTIVAG